MTDNLRDKIAQAIADAIPDGETSNLGEVADEVIRELPTAYVVTSGSYSDYEVKRVYLTREEAEQFIELRGTVRGYDECRIEDFPIGAGRAEYDDALAGVVVHKRKGTTDVARWYVTMTVDELVALITGQAVDL